MSHKLLDTLSELIPELKQPYPDAGEFNSFFDWMNVDIALCHYIELTEFYDNGISENFYFQQFGVDTEQLQNQIQEDVLSLYNPSEDSIEIDLSASIDEYFLDSQIDIMERSEKIIFDHIQVIAQQYQLSLLVIYRENPYWLLIPTQDQEKLNVIVEEFNQAFNAHGDLNMAVY